MRRALPLLAALLAACGTGNPEVELETAFGTIRIEVDSSRAPATAANFLRYVDEGRYDGAAFYRVRREDQDPTRRTTAIVQGGLWRGDSTKILPPVPFEPTSATGLRHTTGTVSLARFGDVESGRSEFFIVVGDQPHLDWQGEARPGYAAFGRVVEGMELVRALAALPVRDERIARPVPFRAVRAER